MAQTTTMGPPLSPRETRRSGRRSAPSASGSTSKSPVSPVSESAPPPSRSKEDTRRPSVSTSNNSSRNRRLKQEDIDQVVDENHKNGTTNGNSRTKRKGKEKEKQRAHSNATIESSSTKLGTSGEDIAQEEEEQGITRCVCGSTEDDPDAGEFMVQCETCKAWQHGLCMGYEAEDQLPDDDYHCEQCRPDLHQDLLKKLLKKGRHSSANSHNNSATTASRLSRSHSPSHMLKQPAKRRNTMNSRDAAFDESLKEIIEATAAEAAANDGRDTSVNGATNGHAEPEEEDVEPSSRKKRKRPEDDAIPKKRTRSASSASDHPITGRSDTPVNSNNTQKTASVSSGPAPKSSNSRKQRNGGRKSALVQDPLTTVDGDTEAPPPPKRSNNSRNKNPSRRPPASSHAPAGVSHEHGTRRNPNGGSAAHGSTAEASRAYRNSHAYAVSQQPLFTSWNLPDYLAHLGPMLPTDVPRPLEIRGSTGDDSSERSMERGVKVKWPSKRMSVGDMNKRVRALVEWVGREQAGALERGRRRGALEDALKSTLKSSAPHSGDNGISGSSVAVVLGGEKGPPFMDVDGDSIPHSTMTMMEDLMKELINFQERFGPGVKNKERERRHAVS